MDIYERYIRRFGEAKRTAEELILPLDNRVFRRKPSSDAWCIGECFSHMNEAGNLYLKKVKDGMRHATGDDNMPDNPMHLRLHMRWFVRYLEPPVSVKTKTPYPFLPQKYANLNQDDVLGDFIELQNQFIAHLERANTGSIDLSSIKISNPVIPLLKMTLAEGIAVTEAHQRRHIAQARNVLSAVDSKKV